MKVCVTALGLVLLAATATATAQPPPRVRGVIQAVEGATLVVATPSDGAVRLTLTDMIVALTTGSRALLVPGAAVMALAAPAQGGGPATAVAVIAETNGVKPPM